MRNISLSLNEHYNAALNYGIKSDQIIGIFLYGSQNYGLQTEDSDVDTKCIYVPTLDNLIFDKDYKPVDLHLPGGEICVLMDIRHFCDNLKYQNINYLETLFVSREHCIVNDLYIDIWYSLLERREEIAHYDVGVGILSQVYQAQVKLKDSASAKDNSTAYRIVTSMEKYMHGQIFEECIRFSRDSEEYKIIMNCKNGTPLNKTAKENLNNKIQKLILYAKSVNANSNKEDIDIFFKKYVSDIIKFYVSSHLNG